MTVGAYKLSLSLFLQLCLQREYEHIQSVFVTGASQLQLEAQARRSVCYKTSSNSYILHDSHTDSSRVAHLLFRRHRLLQLLRKRPQCTVHKMARQSDQTPPSRITINARKYTTAKCSRLAAQHAFLLPFHVHSEPSQQQLGFNTVNNHLTKAASEKWLECTCSGSRENDAQTTTTKNVC